MKERNISKLFVKKVAKNPNKKAIGWIENNNLHFLNNDEYLQKVKIYFYALSKLGFQVQDKASILGNSSKEWHMLDLAIQCARGVVTPVYPTYLPHEVEYIVNHSESKFLFIENEGQLKKILDVQDKLKNLKFLIAIKEVTEELVKKITSKIKFYSFSDFIEIGIEEMHNSPMLFNDLVESGNPNDIASIIYTSGTTGDPKGTVISQKAIYFGLKNWP